VKFTPKIKIFPEFLVRSTSICAESLKRLRRRDFAFGRLITPSLKVADSNSVGHTTSPQVI